ncbi:MAG: flagellar protein FlaG [Lachnospiraceae bacterium]|nr:flagellar protein FlaG [Lachnospiraceae bacterium]
MAIEPLSSVMTYQAQPAVKQQVQPVQSADMEVSPDDQTVNVDTTTAAVTKTQAENSENDGANSGNNANSGHQQQAMNSQSANEQLKKAIAEMNRKISNSNEEAVFGIHEKTNRITIKIVDKDTKEIRKEFPPEKTLDMIAKVWEIAGILVDEKR